MSGPVPPPARKPKKRRKATRSAGRDTGRVREAPSTVDAEPAALGATLARIMSPVVEPEHCHAAFVLWAMQAEDQRSLRGVSRACGRTDSAIRTWSNRWCWSQRADREGHSSPLAAARLWARDYLAAYGRTPVDAVAIRCRPGVASAALADPATGVEEDRSSEDAGATPLDAAAAQGSAPGTVVAAQHVGGRGGGPQFTAAAVIGGRAVVDPHAEARERERERIAKLQAERQRQREFYASTQRLLEAGVGALGRQLRDALSHTDHDDRDKALAKIGIRFAQIPALLQEHRELAEILGVTGSGQVGAPALEPSYRVKLAQEQGTDPLRAMLDDTAEVAAVLQQLLDRGGAAVLAETPAEAPGIIGDASEPPEAATGRLEVVSAS